MDNLKVENDGLMTGVRKEDWWSLFTSAGNYLGEYESTEKCNMLMTCICY